MRFRRLLSLTLIVAIVIAACGCAKKSEDVVITDAADIAGKRVGVALSWGADYVMSKRTDITLIRYDMASSLVMALRYGQIDLIAVERPNSVEMANSISGLEIFDTPVATDKLVVYVCAQRRDVYDDFNSYVSEFIGSQEYEDLQSRLASDDEFEDVPVELTGNGEKILNVGVCVDAYPFAYWDFEKNAFAGSDVEVISRFANERGYTIEFSEGTYTTMEMGVASGKLDVAIGGMADSYREDIEATGAVLLSNPYMGYDIVIMQAPDRTKLKVETTIDY